MALSAPTAISRYQILKRLDEGGPGAVYLARDPALDRLVAVKLLRHGYADAAVRERCIRGARSAARLEHPNIVTIFDVGDHNAQPFIAMEFVRGVSLHHLIRGGAFLPLPRKLRLMDELCAGLQYAHRAGLTHCGVRPKNLMMDEAGVLKILDFGIADAGGTGSTHTDAMIGTVNYMAPEQIGGRAVDARADLFSAGAVFYELLSHRRAFSDDVESGVRQMIVSGRPEPLEAIQPDLDDRIVALVNRCLEKAPTRRYQDMAAIREELGTIRRRFASKEEDDARARDHGAEPVPEPVSDRTKRAEEEVARARDLIRRAREQFDAGDHRAAISSLEAFQPARLVANALAGFRADLQQIGADATASFKRLPMAAPLLGNSSHTVATTTPPPSPAEVSTWRRTRAVALTVAIAAAVAALVWMLLNLR
jgi:eukaryotic-like serine/threonine-protein kinase